MNRITAKKKLAEGVYRYSIENEEIAKAQKPGQFVILRIHEKGERIPLTIVESDSKKGTIDIIFQVVGYSTTLLSELREGDSILDVAGPLGNPSRVENHGKCVMIGGGVGTAVLYPVLKVHKDAGNDVTAIVGARSKSLLILIEEIKKISNDVIITTDDGSAGRKGFVTDALVELLKKEKVDTFDAAKEHAALSINPDQISAIRPDYRRIDFVFAVGPVVMMKKVAEITKEYNVKTVVSLNTIMIDGTGMCGGCRCLIEGKPKFACIDGPEFDAHTVNFSLLERRLEMFKCKEVEALEAHKKKQENVKE